MKHSLIMRSVTISSFIIAGLLNGCSSVGPDYETPASLVESEWLTYKNQQLAETPPLEIKWWESTFNDSTLNNLVEIALSDNLSLRSAGLRVLQARQKLAIAIGNQYPQTQALQGNAQSGADFPASASQQYNAGFNLSWEADIWGRFQRQIESASADLDYSVADYDGVMISLVSDVAQNYLEIRTTQKRLELFRKNLKLQEESLRITEAKYKAGDVSGLDSEQAKTLLFNTRATISSLEPTLQQLKNSLAILLGKPPHDISELLKNNQGLPLFKDDIALGMPQNLLRRRPDIRSAEKQLASQSAQIGYAITELYPHFSIGGVIGTNTGNQGSYLFREDYSNWNTLVSFDWNIFNYGRLKSNIRLQDALFQQLLEDYRETVLEAQGEVENSVVAFLASKEQVVDYTQAVISSTNAARLSQMQYRDGLVNFNTVISILQTLASQQDTLAQTEGNAATDLVTLYKALGGGWEIRGTQLPDTLLPQSTFDEMLKRTDFWEGNLPQ
ncbi:MAG: efflux transporter outer membrane subunit [Gammaproteobacteria bacterium]|nr:efflux transporter outer membrane subunit [Gammaproteobacteria bacterium]